VLGGLEDLAFFISNVSFEKLTKTREQRSIDGLRIPQGAKGGVIVAYSDGKWRLADGLQARKKMPLFDLEVGFQVARKRLEHLFPHRLG
jgi:hypothetical protein